MQTHRDIIDRWPSLSAYAEDIGAAYVTAQVMRFRGSIHPRWWDAVVEAAERRGWHDITHKALSATRPKKSIQRGSEAHAA